MQIPDTKYYECHITVEPLLEEAREAVFKELCKARGFRVAKLLMKKDRTETERRSDKDSFCTGHDSDYASIKSRMQDLVEDLSAYGVKVWRFKIEAIVLDVRLAETRSA
jgi:hypothetical protein